ETLKLDEREIKCHTRKLRTGRDLLDHTEPHQVLAIGFYRSQPRTFIVGDFELLAHHDAQHPRQMMSALPCDFSLTFADPIDEEAAACHVQCVIHPRCRLPKAT